MRPTIKDVGKLAAVSIGTVSNVVNGHPNVSAKTRKRVEDAINKLGYRANRAARSLPAGTTGLLGYWLPKKQSPSPAMDVFLHKIVEHAALIDLEVLLFAPKPGQPDLDAFADILRRGGVDAFVIAGVGYHDNRVDYLSGRKIPFVSFGRIPDRDGTAWVDVDGAAGTRNAVEHLYTMGRRKIAFVGWPEGSQSGDHRARGWKEGAEALGLPHGAELMIRGLHRYTTGIKMAPKLLELECDAAVCVSDTLALGVIEGLRRRNIVIGQDFAITGFDDDPAAALVSPGLTSLRQPMGRVGQALVTQIAAILENKPVESELMYEPELIVRGSSDPSVPITDD